MSRRLLPLAIALVATLILAFAVKGFVREVLIVPVAYAGWLTWLILANLPQWVFWALLVMATSVLAVRSLRGVKHDSPDARPGTTSPQGPVSSWSKRLRNGASQQTSRWRIPRDLGHIFWEARFPDEPFHMQRFLERMDEPTMAMPPEIRDYFKAGLSRPEPTFRSWFRMQRRESAAPLDLDPAVVVHFLEESVDFISTEPSFTDPTGGIP